MLVLVLLGILPIWAFGLNLLMFVFYITSKRKELHPLIKIATFYVQLLDCMISSANIWHDKVLSTQLYFRGLWNLHFTDLSCNLTNLFTPVGNFFLSYNIYNTVFFLGWVSLLLYVVIVPYFIFYLVLLRNRKIIGDEKTAEHQNLEKWHLFHLF